MAFVQTSSQQSFPEHLLCVRHWVLLGLGLGVNKGTLPHRGLLQAVPIACLSVQGTGFLPLKSMF